MVDAARRSEPKAQAREATRLAIGAVPVPPPPPPMVVPVPNDDVEPAANSGRWERPGTRFRGAEFLELPAASSPVMRLTVGRTVPGTRYRIVRWLGEGAMGVVYEAEHVDIERRVALKILRFDLSRRPEMVRVFKEEAKAASRLGSRYVVEVYDFGSLPDGRVFFVMELMHGQDLVAMADRGGEPATVIGILRQVCKGLAQAHAAGIVHRDVKPENIITTVGSDGREAVKVVDFGISAMLAAGQADGSGLAGTPHYMSPEQVAGGAFDGRLDVYSLGCTAYELLTATPLFNGSVEEVMEQQRSTAPEPPSVRRPDLDIPAPLEHVVMRCLAKRPEERFATMEEVEAALCEAQIAARLSTPWDDLPLPRLDDEARVERIAAGMPSRRGEVRRTWMWPIAALASTFAAVGLGFFMAMTPAPSVEEQTRVDALSSQAERAAASARWVVPPRSDPDAPTAISKVLELEALTGPAEALADARGQALRHDFAGTLVRQADELWDHGAKDLASVYYLNALVFDEHRSHALERLDVPLPLLADYLHRAERGELTDEERILALFAAVEVEADPRAREVLEGQARDVIEVGEISKAGGILLVRAGAKRTRDPSEDDDEGRRPRRRTDGLLAALEGALADDPPQRAIHPLPPESEANRPKPDPASPTVDAEPEIDVELEPDPAEPESVGDLDPEPAPDPVPEAKRRPTRSAPKRRAEPDPKLGSGGRNPQKSEALTRQGLDALRDGDRERAAALFHRAIGEDRRNAAALMGLSDVYFDTGDDAKAVDFAEKAVAVAPRHRGYRLRLGDAYFKVLRYRDALEQYEHARERGAVRAADRIDKVRAKLGPE